jgi:hypothetical protein
LRARGEVVSSEPEDEFQGGLFWERAGVRWEAEDLTETGELNGPDAVGEETEVADPDEAMRDDVQ